MAIGVSMLPGSNELFWGFGVFLALPFPEGLSWGLASQGEVPLPPTEAVFQRGVLSAANLAHSSPLKDFAWLLALFLRVYKDAGVS